MESKIKFKPNPEYHLMDQVSEVLQYYHYSCRTEQSYSSWILQYIKFLTVASDRFQCYQPILNRLHFITGNALTEVK